MTTAQSEVWYPQSLALSAWPNQISCATEWLDRGVMHAAESSLVTMRTFEQILYDQVDRCILLDLNLFLFASRDPIRTYRNCCGRLTGKWGYVRRESFVSSGHGRQTASMKYGIGALRLKRAIHLYHEVVSYKPMWESGLPYSWPSGVLIWGSSSKDRQDSAHGDACKPRTRREVVLCKRCRRGIGVAETGWISLAWEVTFPHHLFCP